MQIDNLLQGYSCTIQWGISHGATYKEAKQGNELLHKFCESLSMAVLTPLPKNLL